MFYAEVRLSNARLLPATALVLLVTVTGSILSLALSALRWSPAGGALAGQSWVWPIASAVLALPAVVVVSRMSRINGLCCSGTQSGLPFSPSLSFSLFAFID